jgi:dTDP-4-dehydrorhamnose reductase
MLGQDLIEILDPGNEVIGWDLADLDITQERQTIDRISSIRPKVIINCAAYTNVDGSETEKSLAFSVNSEGARNVAIASTAANALLVYLSTDYIFDGSAQTPYHENSSPNPLNIYGRSKLQGEIHVQERCKNHLIIRTAWLYGHKGNNFVEAILRQAERKKELQVVNDQLGSPTFTRDLSGAINDLLDTAERGIFHVTNSGSCTWFEFAEAILRAKGFMDRIVHPISSQDLNRLAKRPAYSVLDCTRYERATGKKMRHWLEGLRDYFS